jgi:GntR family transcriptional regulator
LAEGGLIETRRGAGHFVARRILKPVTRLTGFTDDMVSRGIQPVSKILEKTIMPVPPDTAFRTALPLGTPVFVLVRLRLAFWRAIYRGHEARMDGLRKRLGVHAFEDL